MYENAKSHVSLNNKLSEAFQCRVGVRQGENLSPLLFAIYLRGDTFFQKNIFITRVIKNLYMSPDRVSLN